LKRLKRPGIAALTVIATIRCASVEEQVTCTRPISEQAPETFWVQPLPTDRLVIAHVPQGRFVLLRRGRTVQAIRFLTVRPAETEGTGKGCATYEALEFVPGRPTRRCVGIVSEFALRGSHLTAYQPGRVRFRCGRIPATYGYPTQVWAQAATEVAPTRWTEASQIVTTHPRLKWYSAKSVNTGESAISIAISELP
jgi:hypothetical protein